MLKPVFRASLSFALISTTASAQVPTDHVKIDVTRADLQLIGQGIMKLPYETAAPLLIELLSQLQAQTPRAEGPGTGGTVPPKPEVPAKK